MGGETLRCACRAANGSQGQRTSWWHWGRGPGCSWGWQGQQSVLEVAPRAVNPVSMSPLHSFAPPVTPRGHSGPVVTMTPWTPSPAHSHGAVSCPHPRHSHTPGPPPPRKPPRCVSQGHSWPGGTLAQRVPCPWAADPCPEGDQPDKAPVMSVRFFIPSLLCKSCCCRQPALSPGC